MGEPLTSPKVTLERTQTEGSSRAMVEGGEIRDGAPEGNSSNVPIEGDEH